MEGCNIADAHNNKINKDTLMAFNNLVIFMLSNMLESTFSPSVLKHS